MHKQIQIQESLLHWPRPKLTKHWDGWSRTMTSKEPNTFKVKDHGIPKQMTKDHCIPRNIIYQGRWHWWLKSTRTPPSINCHWRVCYVIQIGNLGVILLLAKVVTLLCRTALRESRLQGQFLPFWSQKCFTDYRPLVWRLSMLQRREEDFFAEKTSCLEIYFSCLISEGQLKVSDCRYIAWLLQMKHPGERPRNKPSFHWGNTEEEY